MAVDGMEKYSKFLQIIPSCESSLAELCTIMVGQSSIGQSGVSIHIDFFLIRGSWSTFRVAFANGDVVTWIVSFSAFSLFCSLFVRFLSLAQARDVN